MTQETIPTIESRIDTAPIGPWVAGALFYVIENRLRFRLDCTEYKDFLQIAMTKGLLPPAHPVNGDSNTELSRDQVVALRRYDPEVSVIPSLRPNSAVVFVDSDFPVATASELGVAWDLLADDEVYSLEPIPPERLSAFLP